MSKQRRKRKRQKYAQTEQRRAIGFHCVYCPRSNAYNERFVPDYYRAEPGHRRDPHMCFACHVEGVNEKRRTRKPRLNAETLKEFWQQDTSPEQYLHAAASYFEVPLKRIIRVMDEIKF